MPSSFQQLSTRAVLRWLFLASLFGVLRVQGATLVWDSNTETNLAGYIVYVDDGQRVDSFDVHLETRFPLGGLARGFTYRLYVTAYNTEGIESDPSEVVEYAAPHLPPRIVAQPSNLSAWPNIDLPLSIQATGTGGLHYQWYRDGKPLPNATNSAYILRRASSLENGFYSVQVSNPGGTVASEPFQVQVKAGPFAPVIYKQPRDATAVQDFPVQLSIGTLSDTALSYQWWKNGVPIPGATNASLAIPNAGAEDAGKYFATVKNSSGLIPTQSAQIIVVVPPAIDLAPESSSAVFGTDFLLFVQASGTGPLQYQWFKDGVPIAGATDSILTLSEVKFSDAGSYTVEISSPFGSVVSSAAAVTVLNPPVILAEPDIHAVRFGASARFSVTADGSEPLSYQWFKDLLPIADATNSVLTIPAATYSDSGDYFVTVSNPAGTVSTAPVTFSVGGPRFLADPSATVVEGSTLWLNIPVEGEEPLSYQWYKNGVLLPGQTGPSFVISNASVEDEGVYAVSVTNPRGAARSADGQLTVLSPPHILAAPQGTNVTYGSPASFNVEVHGMSPLKYQWLKDGERIEGATNRVFELAVVESSDAGFYSVIVSNTLGVATSEAAELVVFTPPPPRIVGDPLSQTVYIGFPLRLSIEIADETQAACQWLKNGEPIPGATNLTFELPSVESNDAGQYNARISNVISTVVSDVAWVTVEHAEPDQLSGKISIELSPSGEILVEANGIPGQVYDVQVRTNFFEGDWETISTVTVEPGGTFTITPPAGFGTGALVLRTVRR